MTPKEAVEKIKELFGAIPPPAAGATTTDHKTKDGKTITCEGAMAGGSKVVMKTADGTASVLPDGDYTLEDGTVISVAAGVITNVVAPAAPDPNAMPTDMAEVQKGMGDLKQALTDVLARFDADKKELNDKIDAQKTDFDSFVTTVKEGFKLVETIASAPAVPPIAAPVNKFAAQKEKDDVKLKNIAETISKLKQA